MLHFFKDIFRKKQFSKKVRKKCWNFEISDFSIFSNFFRNSDFSRKNLNNNFRFVLAKIVGPEIKISIFRKNIFLTQNRPADPKIILINPCDDANGV